MASTAGLPLSLHQDGLSLLLSDSEDEDTPLTPREPILRHEHTQSSLSEKHGNHMEDKTTGVAASAPRHPIPAMQAAFAESLIEATANPAAPKPKLRFADGKERRTRLLDGEKDEELYADSWRYRPGQSHHEIWKLMAQITFGVYLLLNGIANSNAQVVNILQGHIDEMDEFLEVTMEDINLALEDVQERLDFLKLPMENMATFEKMLEDRAFRLQIVTGNEKIEHIISRTTTALDASMNDVKQGLQSTKAFAVWLGNQQNHPWRIQRPDVIDVFDAMKGNTEGWYKAFMDLQTSASKLDKLLTRLSQMVTEMDRRAGEVSRRTIIIPRTSVLPELNIRASALMPLQFSVPSFTDTMDIANAFPRIPEETSPKYSQESSPGGKDKSASRTSSESDSRHSQTDSPFQQSPPSSPAVKEFLLPSTQYKPERRVSSMLKVVPALEIVAESDTEEGTENDDDEEIGQTETEDEDEEPEEQEQSPAEDEGLYILQPRTYTPLPPEPARTPIVADTPVVVQVEETPKRTSLRQRLSLRGSNPPESIQIPPRNVNRPSPQAARGHSQIPPSRVQSQAMAPRIQSQAMSPRIQSQAMSPRIQSQAMSPRIQSQVHSPHIQYAQPNPDSAYGSDSELRPPYQSVADHLVDLSPPAMPPTIPSPRSDQQYFRPVQASPHSPLQRPWTAVPQAVPRPHTSATQYRSYSGHQRNAPSAMGMSMLSNVTTLNPQGKTLKKKKSAFGWLKKAFALDDEERAAFEARKNLEAPNLYHEARSPKYLDGKRRDQYRQY
ncbi:hypothetical protein BX600DRAFT_505774 [Xylariales sp. PMI_506]|nr:hypothetical protein BX600DRAFT_505774 [Xylariales sp. PMI_506]